MTSSQPTTSPSRLFAYSSEETPRGASLRPEISTKFYLSWFHEEPMRPTIKLGLIIQDSARGLFVYQLNVLRFETNLLGHQRPLAYRPAKGTFVYT